ncbi:MAG TPA: 3-hydroxyacyl-CoA dehydrogenase NAD-binding domain-containing protein, partial [Gemmataceae bacterium]|nr:3-hydroxyacyl-CoA dehydrogenase NAD-binding domain-containing protein [Gemmataceae bacterium]
VLPGEPADPTHWPGHLAFAQGGKRPKKGLPLRTWRQKLLESNRLGHRLILGGTERLLRQKVPDDMPAPGEALEAVRVGVTQGMEAGLAREREAIGRLATTPACRNLIGLFFAREAARQLPAEEAAPPVRRVGVVGAGVMGAGIAQLAAFRGLEVVVQEVNEEALGAGLLRITGLFEKAQQRGLLSPEEARRRLALVKGTTTWQGFDEAEVVIEAAVEDLGAKRAVFRELDARTKPTAVLATNTSSLPVASLAEGLAHPERVAGLHFFNPVHKMPLVEVVRAPATEEGVIAALRRLTVHLNKTPVVVKDSPGFVVNRVLMPYLHEAVLLVAEGLDIEDVDRTMRRFGMPMGPLELLDQVGLDVAAHVARAVRPVFEKRFPPGDALERMRDCRWLGQKNGVGFYRYQGKKRVANEAALPVLRPEKPLPSVTATLPPTARAQEARERMVLLMVNEAALCLAEGLAADAASIDLAMVLGTGWAPHRGGPLRYAEDRGPADVVRRLTELAGRLGPRFEPCEELRRRAAPPAR